MRNRTHLLIAFSVLIVQPMFIRAQDPPLPLQLREAVEQWRSTQLPATDPEAYWTTLKTLGERIDEPAAARIRTAKASDLQSAIALMAHYVAREPEKAQELADWYGVPATEIPSELVEAMIQRLQASGYTLLDALRILATTESEEMRGAPQPLSVRVIHMHPDYLPFWQAWLLAPPVEPTTRYMRQNLHKVLSELGDDRTITLLVQKCDQLHDELSSQLDGEPLQQRLREQSSRIFNVVRAIGGRQAVRGLLAAVRIAERDGYVGEGHTSFRTTIVQALTSRENHLRLREMHPEVFEGLRVPGKAVDDPAVLPPFDEKWKEFKPIIEELLQRPDQLLPGDTEVLREALAIMPEG